MRATANIEERICKRVDLLLDMNNYIENFISDENLLEYWNTYGIPENCDLDTYIEIAQDTSLFGDISRTFVRCI